MTLDIKHWNQNFTLYPHFGVYWKELDALLIADVHIGKDGHFRKEGIAIPNRITANDVSVLQLLLNESTCKKVIFLGDLFHSDFNQTCHHLQNLISNNPTHQFILVKGNHDIIHEEQIYDLGIHQITDEIIFNEISLTHIPINNPIQKNIAGHFHPAIKMQGKARMGLKIPAFYFGNHQVILPAFSPFSGHATVKPKKGEKVFIVLEGEVLQL